MSDTKRAQVTVAVSIGFLAVCAAAYRLLHGTAASQTAAFYIGLPALLAIGLVLTRPAKSVTGTIVKVLTIGLLLSPVVLNESAICVLIAAPLFYLVGIGIGLIVDNLRRRDAWRPQAMALLLVPLALAMTEGTTDATTLPAANSVTAARTVAAEPGAVRASLAGMPCFDDAPRPWTLRLFPLLAGASGTGLRPGDERRIAFRSSHAAGELRIRVARSGADHVRFTVVSDTSPMAHWWGLREAVVRWHAVGNGQTRVTWTLSYVRLLAPAAYFGPIEHAAARETAGYLIDAVATPHAC